MKKTTILTLLTCSSIYAQTQISVTPTFTDYTNSKTKIDGKGYEISLNQDFNNSSLALSYDKSTVDRIGTNPSLEVSKIHTKYEYKFTPSLHAKVNYIAIDDNIAPTDNGKIYGIAGRYIFQNNMNLQTAIYKSDYPSFNVIQLDATISKPFSIGTTKSKLIFGIKKIDIDGDKYNNYSFKDKNYLTYSLALTTNVNTYQANIGTLLKKRLFAVLEDGTKVQHHAVEQDKTYFISLGKKIANFQLNAKYSFQNGIELPENQHNVKTKTTSINITYNF